jgi:hypothetical protein
LSAISKAANPQLALLVIEVRLGWHSSFHALDPQILTRLVQHHRRRFCHWSFLSGRLGEHRLV